MGINDICNVDPWSDVVIHRTNITVMHNRINKIPVEDDGIPELLCLDWNKILWDVFSIAFSIWPRLYWTCPRKCWHVWAQRSKLASIGWLLGRILHSWRLLCASHSKSGHAFKKWKWDFSCKYLSRFRWVFCNSTKPRFSELFHT